MKKLYFKSRILLLITVLFMYPALQAQVYTGNLNLTTQAQVDAFNYTKVTGYLFIGDWWSNITDLTPLQNLTSVGGDLYIIGNRAMTSLDGLQNLTSVGGDLCIQYTALTALNGLQNLTSVGGDLNISGNGALISLDGLQNLTSVEGNLNFEWNYALTSLDGLQNLTFAVADFYFFDNTALTTLNGLQNLTSVGGSFVIDHSVALTSLDGLQNLTSVGGNFIIWCNDALTSLDGLQNLTSVGGVFVIDQSGALTSLDGLKNLTSVGGYLQIVLNAALSEFCGLYNLLDGGGLAGAYYVYSNLANPTQQEIIEAGPCNTTPIAICQDVSISADENCQAMVTAAEVDDGSSDPDGDEITLTLTPEGPFNVGVTPVTLTVTDVIGATDQCTATITVTDDTPPVLNAITNPITLWPPNHKYETIEISQLNVSVVDNCASLTIDDVYISDVSSDEPEDAPGGGDGKTVNDIVISTDCASVDLRKERSGNGNGRVYTIYLAVDDGNNTGTTSCLVYVPHNNGGIAIDDGMYYQESCGSKSSFIAATADAVQLMNYPNPFTNSTTIEYQLDQPSDVTISFFNQFGKQVDLIQQKQQNGKQQVVWNAEGLPSGIYFFRLQAGDRLSKGKIVKID